MSTYQTIGLMLLLAKSAIRTFIMSLLTALIFYGSYAYASDKGNRDIKEPRYYIHCRDKANHRELYKFGDELSAGWFKS
jgi:hypothetical protein